MDDVGPVGGSHIPEMGESNVDGSNVPGSIGAITSRIAETAQNLVNSGGQTGALNYLKGAITFLATSADENYPDGAQFPAIYADVSSGHSDVKDAIAKLINVANDSSINRDNLFQYIQSPNLGAGVILSNVGSIMETTDNGAQSVNVTNSNQMSGLLETAEMVMQGADSIPSLNGAHSLLYHLCNTVLHSLNSPGSTSTVNFMQTICRCVPTNLTPTETTSSVIKDIWTQLPSAISTVMNYQFGNPTTGEFSEYVEKLQTFLSNNIADSVIESGENSSLVNKNNRMNEAVQPEMLAILEDGSTNNGTPKNLEVEVKELDRLINTNLPKCFPD